MAEPKVRLHVDQPLGPGQAVALDKSRANYLFAVMRLPVGASVLLFNGRDGEWRAEVAEATKRRGILVCRDQTHPQAMPPDLWLLFAPVRKGPHHLLVEKAVELGVRRLVPVTTRFTNADRLRTDKERAHATEAAEQCGALFVPEVTEPQPLERALAGWPADRRLYWADEGLAGTAGPWPGVAGEPAALLIGPEGGFSPPRNTPASQPCPPSPPSPLAPASCAPETAALAALTLWQAQFGDWR